MAKIPVLPCQHAEGDDRHQYWGSIVYCTERKEGYILTWTKMQRRNKKPGSPAASTISTGPSAQ